ncbi:MAG: 23S rRNA pseudouridine(2605) synthase RluB [Gammaproteobacteria bacterium]|nr:23S rRNA pseudouridine(2605) synthase RluB [Gammaproteobacteria bacterium]
MAERLQKVLARAGYGSRREIEEWIRAGKITVNGKPAELGVSVSSKDRISIDGRLIKLAEEEHPPRTLIYHKPAGELTTRKDEAGRPTVFDSLPRIRNARWITIGRLDFNTSGLLLVTTDGELAHRLMHPSWEIEREYAVRILGKVDDQVLQRLLEGVMLDDGMAAFGTIKDAGGEGANHWYHVTVREGRNREVRRLWESQGLQVSRLIRVRFGPIALPAGLSRGRFRDLERKEVEALYTVVKLSPPKQAAARRAPPRRGTARRGKRVR